MEVDSPQDQKVEYKLSRIIPAHSNDVKALAVTEVGAIVSASRDEWVRMFVNKEGEYEKFLEINNKQMVNSVEVFHCPDGSILIFCGRKDGTIAVFNAESPEPQFILQEHSLNVCVLKVNQASGQLISGSWDSRAVVFNINDLIFNRTPKQFTLEGHALSIWAVEFVSKMQNTFLTASADKKIKLWSGNTILQTFTGHKDVVRCLQAVSSERFISAGNDSTVRVWNTLTGKCEQTFESTTGEFIYSMSTVQATDQQFVITSGENGYVEIYQCVDGVGIVCYQAIRTPVTSLWSIQALPNGDFAVAASNGLIYVFSASLDRIASADVQEVFESDVASKVAIEVEMRAIQDSDTVTIKVSLDDGAPNMELKYVKGSNPADAAENFIRENNLPYSYLNEIIEYIKANIPEAREYGTYKPTKTSNIQQKEKADYTFEVGADSKKLNFGYNVGDDPDMTAQKFCEENKLPITFVPQLSNLLRAQVPELQGLQGQAYADPLTGQGRYVPSSSSSNANTGGGDPLTGSGRYVPGSGLPATNGASSGGDPLTSGSRYIPGQDTSHTLLPNSLTPIDKRRPRSELVPIRQYYTFGYEGASTKAQEVLKNANQGVINELILEEPLIESLVEMLAGNFTANEIHTMALEKALQWPLESIVPALDAFRLGLLDQSINEYFCSTKDNNHGHQTLERLSTILVCEPAIPVRILICRSLANASKHQAGRDMLILNLSQISELITRQICFGGSKPALQLAAASCLANIALILLRQTEKGVCAELGPREDVLRAIIKCTETIQSFGDCSEPALLRLLQAIVTLMWGDSTVIDMGKSRGIEQIVMRIKDAVQTDNSKNVARDIYAMIHAN